MEVTMARTGGNTRAQQGHSHESDAEEIDAHFDG